MPDGPGKDEVLKICGTCHPAERGASVRLTREGWQDVMRKMMALGAKGTDEELNAGPRVPRHALQGRRGGAAQPEHGDADPAQSIVGLLRKESAAWIAYRTKTPCKTLDDLKKVAGVDFTKIEERRDRLVCF